jgi:hypothetical protein
MIEQYITNPETFKTVTFIVVSVLMTGAILLLKILEHMDKIEEKNRPKEKWELILESLQEE